MVLLGYTGFRLVRFELFVFFGRLLYLVYRQAPWCVGICRLYFRSLGCDRFFYYGSFGFVSLLLLM